MRGCRHHNLHSLVPSPDKKSPRRDPLAQVLIFRPREGIPTLDDDILLAETVLTAARCSSKASFGYLSFGARVELLVGQSLDIQSKLSPKLVQP